MSVHQIFVFLAHFLCRLVLLNDDLRLEHTAHPARCRKDLRFTDSAPGGAGSDLHQLGGPERTRNAAMTGHWLSELRMQVASRWVICHHCGGASQKQ